MPRYREGAENLGVRGRIAELPAERPAVPQRHPHHPVQPWPFQHRLPVRG
ncbi:hypothetical protein [Streptomyces niveus]